MGTGTALGRRMPPPVQREIPGMLTLKGQAEAVRNEDDVTLHIGQKEFVEAANEVFGQKDQIPEKTPTIDLSGKMQLPSGDELKRPRLHAALSFAAGYYSVTIRTKKKNEKEGGNAALSLGHLENDPSHWKEVTDFLKFVSLDEGDWGIDKAKHWTSLCEVADIIYPVAFTSKPHSGLVLITGGTGSGKTTVLNGLLARYLAALFRRDGPELERRPHIVAVGDPVETAFYDKSLMKSAEMQIKSYAGRRIDFTARVIGTDTPSVEAALEDALRETTTAVVISELRRDEDFRATLKFAATGQLVFATSHNTSLVDALRKLMMFSGKDGPSNRSLLAQRLKAVVHLQKVEVGGKSAALPSVWLANSPGIRNFVSDGLSSLLPHGAEEQDVGILGQAWAAKKLCEGNLDLLREAHKRDLPIR